MVIESRARGIPPPMALKNDEGGAEEAGIAGRKRVRALRPKLADLAVCTELIGTAVSIVHVAASEHEGLAHLSKVANDREENADDYVLRSKSWMFGSTRSMPQAASWTSRCRRARLAAAAREPRTTLGPSRASGPASGLRARSCASSPSASSWR